MQRIQFLKHRMPCYFIIKISHECRTGMTHSVRVCTVPHIWSWVWVPTMLVHVHVYRYIDQKKFHWGAGHQEVNKCCTRGESLHTSKEAGKSPCRNFSKFGQMQQPVNSASHYGQWGHFFLACGHTNSVKKSKNITVIFRPILKINRYLGQFLS